MDKEMTVDGKEYTIIKLLGHGKGGYSYLAENGGQSVVLKQIHHEPCDYYSFGNKIESECRDYQRLKDAGIRIPKMLAGDTIFDYVRNGISVEPYLEQVMEMASKAKDHMLNIDYFPTNFVVSDRMIWYVDYECNEYKDEWSFESWGIRYWSRTTEFEEYLKDRSDRVRNEGYSISGHICL